MAAQSSEHGWVAPVHPWDGDAYSSGDGETWGGKYTEEEDDAPATPGDRFVEEQEGLYLTR
eukprot:9273633-Lingulodinium_polyedra.AAC.1